MEYISFALTFYGMRILHTKKHFHYLGFIWILKNIPLSFHSEVGSRKYLMNQNKNLWSTGN